MTRSICTVLIVAASPSDREQYRCFLLADVDHTYRFLEASSMATGLELCRTHAIDAVLLGYRLADGEGLEFLAASGNAASPPVVMVTGEGDERVAVQSIKLGAADYLPKQGLTPELLQSTLRRAIEEGHLRTTGVGLQESNLRITTIWESMTDAYVTLDREWRIVYANQAATGVIRQLSGLEPEEFLGKTHWQVFPWSIGQTAEQEYRRAISEQVAVHFEMLYEPTANWFEVHAYPSAEGLGVYFRDISDRKQAEIALRESEERWQLALQANNDGIWDHNLRTDTCILSDRFLKILGYTSAELDHLSKFLSYVHPDDLERLQATWQQHLNRETETYRCEYQVRCKDDRYKWVLARGRILWDHQGNPVRAVGSLTDITEAKHVEATLQTSERKFRAVFNQTFELMGLISLDGTVLDVNQAALDAVSTQSQAVVGKPFWETPWWTYSLEVQNQLKAAIEQAVGGQVTRYDVPFHNATGDLCTLDFSLKPVFDQNEQVVVLVAEGHDISDRIRNEYDRNQAEQALQEQTKLLQLIVDSVGDGLILANSQGEFMLFNQAAERLFGRLTNERPCDEWSRTYGLFLPDQQTFFPDRELPLYQAMQGKHVADVEVFVRRDLTLEGRWVSISGFPVLDQKGGITGGAITCRDITDRKYNEQRLRESEERLQLGIYVAGVALARFDYRTDTVTLSPEAAALYGIPADELTITRDRFHATFHPDEQAMLDHIIEQITNPTSSGWFAQDHRVVWPSGEVRWLSVRKQIFFDRSGEIPRPDYAILAAIDITDRKQSDAALRQSEERYRYLAGLIPQLVWIATPDGRLLDVNERWLMFTGLTLEQAQGQGWEAIVHPEDLATLGQHWLAAQQEDSTYQAEGRMRRADGVYRWHLHQAMPLKDEQGQVTKWFGTATDIQELKQIQVERAQLLAEAQSAREEAEAANRSKDDFVAIVAHELRSPLNSIAGWAQLLQTRQFDPAITAKALDTIWRNTQAQVRLVEDLLDISRLVRGTLQINLAPVNWAEVVEAALDVVRPMAEAKQIQLTAQFSPTAQIFGDPNRLQQIAVNLLTNAIKFTPAGGRVEVQLERVEAEVQLCIRDTGKGITADFLPMVFERFQQGQQSTGSKDGLGLGLAIVKNLVELHSGTIVAESGGEGQGSTFTVRLPGIDAVSLSNPAPISQVAPLAGVRVLAVDDEPDMLNLIAFILQDAGAEVKAVSQAAAALESLPEFKPDILLTDIAMPDRTGYELVQQVRLLPEGQIPIIALTAYASATYEERSLQAGFQQHLSKPIEAEDLIAAIIRLLEGRT